MDRRIFGAMKSEMRAELNRNACEVLMNIIKMQRSQNQDENASVKSLIHMPQITKADATQILFRIWDRMPKYQILNGWQIAIYGKETGEDV